MPQRIQISRAAGWRLPAGTMIVDRRTIYGNPFSAVYCGTVEVAVRQFRWCLFAARMRRWDRLPRPLRAQADEAVGRLPERIQRMIGKIDLWPARLDGEAYFLRLVGALPQLRGRDLGCWCAPGALCHADVLLQVANAPSPVSDRAGDSR